MIVTHYRSIDGFMTSPDDHTLHAFLILSYQEGTCSTFVVMGLMNCRYTEAGVAYYLNGDQIRNIEASLTAGHCSFNFANDGSSVIDILGQDNQARITTTSLFADHSSSISRGT